MLFLSLAACGGGGGGGDGYTSGGSGGSGNTLPPGTSSFTVDASLAPNSYSMNGVANPTITLTRGQTYTFNVSASGHPFYIMSVQGTNIGNAFNTGVTGNGASFGTVTFTVPAGAPSTLYYDCSVHSAMTGVITIN
jgi:hypothetical protein